MKEEKEISKNSANIPSNGIFFGDAVEKKTDTNKLFEMSFSAAGVKREPFDLQFKALVIGSPAAGKAHILRCLIGDVVLLHQHNLPSIGMDFHTKLFTIHDGARVKMQLWNSSRQHMYFHATSAYLKGSKVTLAHYYKDINFVLELKVEIGLFYAAGCCICVQLHGSRFVRVHREVDTAA